VLARTLDLFHHRPAAGLRPTAARTPAPADASTGDLCCTVVGERTQQPLQLPVGLQLVVAAERGDHLLTHLVAFTPALDNLQMGASG